MRIRLLMILVLASMLLTAEAKGQTTLSSIELNGMFGGPGTPGPIELQPVIDCDFNVPPGVRWDCSATLFTNRSFSPADAGQVYYATAANDPSFNNFVSFLTNGVPNTMGFVMSTTTGGGGVGFGGVSEREFLWQNPPPGVDFAGFQISRIGIRINTLTQTLQGPDTVITTFALTFLIEGRAGQTPPVQTVFLVHGINQHGGEGTNGGLRELAANLRAGIDHDRFVVDAGFDYGDCAARSDCAGTCSITDGANRLAQYIRNSSSVGDIVLVGYSMGGLIARQMILDHQELFVSRRVSLLLTIGAPHLGYPYESEDDLVRCPRLVRDMMGDFRNPPLFSGEELLQDDAGHSVTVSHYLADLNSRWRSSFRSDLPALWAVAGGAACSSSIRTGTVLRGCADYRPWNDGVVCEQSAELSDWVIENGPDLQWKDDAGDYVHSLNFSYFCPLNPGFPLDNPPADGRLMQSIFELLNGLTASASPAGLLFWR